MGVNQVITYYFDIEKCKKCHTKDGFHKYETKSKTYSISIKSDLHVEQSRFRESENLKKKSKNDIR